MNLLVIFVRNPPKIDLRRGLLTIFQEELCGWRSTSKASPFHRTLSGLVNVKETPHVQRPSRGFPFKCRYINSIIPAGSVKRRPKNTLFLFPALRQEERRPGGQSETKGLFETTSEQAPRVHEDGPLGQKELRALVERCSAKNRQITIGWRGWSNSYIGEIHNYWKRSEICKLKCKGAITLDMDFMCKRLEEQTGGKVVGRDKGTVFLYRGHNYSYWENRQRVPVFHRDLTQRPKKPLPIPWKLTKQDVLALRARGRELPALCKLNKSGLYLTLLDDVRKAFESEDLVRVNGQALDAKSLKTLGAKLQTLVPCELISYEFQHILMWRNKERDSPSDESTESLVE